MFGVDAQIRSSFQPLEDFPRMNRATKSRREPPPKLTARPLPVQPRYISSTPAVPPREPKVRVLFEHPRQTFQQPVQISASQKVIERPEEKDICLKFDPPKDDLDRYQTDIGRLLTSRPLPFCVRMRADYHYPGCAVELTKGTLLGLHFIHRRYRVYATDHEDTEYYLPIQSRQLYQVLPIDPIHDDRHYDGTRDLIKARPLPRRVIVEEAHLSEHPGESQDRGDIIEIERIERRPVPIDSDDPPQMCVIGTCDNRPIAFSESMDAASYSTMPSVDFMSLSEIVHKFPLPLRIRKADNPDFVMMLHRWEEEYHVAATSGNPSHVLSIPATWDGDMEVLENAALHNYLKSVLPPLYPLVNATWGLREPGRLDLQPNMQQVAQPMMEILDRWSTSQEGQEFVINTSKTNVGLLKTRIEGLMDEKKRLLNELKLYRVEAPAPPPREDVISKKPPVPPRTSSSSSKSIEAEAQDEDDGEYEEPLPSLRRGNFHVTVPEAQRELKALLEGKNAENSRLNDKVKRLERENQALDEKNASLVEEIMNLQTRLDEAEADPMYDTLEDRRAAYSNTSSGPVYGDRGVLPPGNHLDTYDEGGVCNMLRELKFEKYVPHFKENAVDGELLASLDAEDLYAELGMSRLHAKKLMIEIKKRKK